jgi:hypothetical protein
MGRLKRGKMMRNGETDVVVRTTLATWENSVVDSAFDVFRAFLVLSEENETSARATECFVSVVGSLQDQARPGCTEGTPTS